LIDQKNQVLDARGTKQNVSSVDTTMPPAVIQDGVSVISAITNQSSFPQGHQNPNNTNSGATVGPAGTRFGRRRLNAIHSSRRNNMNQNRSIKSTGSTLRVQAIDVDRVGFAELDTHADTTCIGVDCRVLSVTDQVCQVLPYHKGYQPFDEVPIVQAATAYDHPETGITYILIFNQALSIPDLETTLINPNQLRANGLIVNDIPKHLSPNPTELSHSIYCPEGVYISLQLKGIISGCRTRFPSIEEVESCKWVTLTSDAPWDPKSPEFEENEAIKQRELAAINTEQIKYHIWGIDSGSRVDLTDDMMRKENIFAVDSNNRVPSEELENKVSRTFKIGLETAKRTLRATTQLAL
jgi:hypothetical protein